MRALIAAFLLASTGPAFSQQATAANQKLSDTLKTHRIPLLNLEKKTFQECLAVITEEWRKQQPDVPFPVATIDYLPADGQRKDALISLKAEDVPFSTALIYLTNASKRRLRFQNSGLITMEMALWIEEDWYAETHRADAKLLAILRLNLKSTSEEVAAVYQNYGLKLESPRMVDGGIEFIGLPSEHEQVAGINHLLRNGYKIVKE